MKRGKFFVAVVSHLRPERVKAMKALVGDATWVVGSDPEEVRAYKQMTPNVIAGGKLQASRNILLNHCQDKGLTLVLLADDLMQLTQATAAHKRIPLKFNDALKMMDAALDQTGAKLAGVPPTDNPLGYNAKTPIRTCVFCIADFMMIRPSDLRFDPLLKLKDDYDLTAQHVTKFGCIARCEKILAKFIHRTNAGGATGLRTDAVEQADIASLEKKWPGYFTRQKKKPNEVLFVLGRK